MVDMVDHSFPIGMALFIPQFVHPKISLKLHVNDLDEVDRGGYTGRE